MNSKAYNLVLYLHNSIDFYHVFWLLKKWHFCFFIFTCQDERKNDFTRFKKCYNFGDFPTCIGQILAFLKYFWIKSTKTKQRSLPTARRIRVEVCHFTELVSCLTELWHHMFIFSNCPSPPEVYTLWHNRQPRQAIKFTQPVRCLSLVTGSTTSAEDSPKKIWWRRMHTHKSIHIKSYIKSHYFIFRCNEKSFARGSQA